MVLNHISSLQLLLKEAVVNNVSFSNKSTGREIRLTQKKQGRCMALQKYIDNILDDKVLIVQNWLNNHEVEQIFNFYELNKELFIKEYSFIILNIYKQYANEQTLSGETENIDNLLSFFENKKVKNYEIFIVCQCFKTVLLEYLNTAKISTPEIEKEINQIFDLSYTVIAKQYYISLEKIIKDQQDILIEQSKSAAMGEMISMIAHQWRQPLQAVSILVQKLPLTKMIEGELSDELLDQAVDEVGVQIDYMSKTIDDFRDFFKPNKPKERVKISALIDKVAEFLLYMINIDCIHLNIEKTDDKVISTYTNEVVQVLINIIKNARDAMISNDIENRILNIRLYTIEKYAVIEIEDNAGGIKEDIISKVFDPYFSTKENKNGTGLGLYMSKRIIEQHCLGNISVANSQQGAVFKIELPI